MRRMLFLLTVLMTMISCSTTKTVEVPVIVEKNHTEFVHTVDTIFSCDSVFVSEKSVGDTLYIIKEKYNNIYRVRLDTLIVRDTIPTITTVTKTEQVKYIPGYYKRISRLFWGLISLIGIFVIFRIYKMKFS